MYQAHRFGNTMPEYGINMIEVKNVNKSYGKKLVLNNISLYAEKGEAIGILGVNGSGKSTLLSHLAKHYAGSKEIKLGYLPQNNPLFEELKPIDNIRMWTSLSKEEIINKINEPPILGMGINNFLDTPVSAMSGGMKKRLSLATVLINDPDVLLLDEPFAALDLVAKKDILSFMAGYLKQNKTIIVASHDEDIFRFCNRVYLLSKGNLVDTNTLNANGISYADLLRSN